MDLNKLIQMAMEHSHKLAKKYNQEQQVQALVNSNTLLIMARTINRLVPAQQIEAEFQTSLEEIRSHYFQHADCEDDEEVIEWMTEMTGLAKNSAIDVLKIADDMEID